MFYMSEFGKIIWNSKEIFYYVCNFLKRIRVFDIWKYDIWEKF